MSNRPRRRLAHAVLAAVLVAGTACDREPRAGESGRGSARSQRSSTTSTSLAVVELAPSSQPLPPVAAEYRVVRRTVDGVGDRQIVNTEVLTVRRPFASRLEVLAGAPPGGAAVQLRTSRIGELTTGSPTQDSVVLAVAPDLAAGDMRADAVVEAAVAAGLARRGASRVIAGRPCRVIEYVGAPLATDLRVAVESRDPAGDSAALCVDADGIVLAETYIADGVVVRTTEAVEVVVGAPAGVPDEVFATNGIAVPASSGGGDTRVLPDDQDLPGRQWLLPTPPKGFTRLARYSVVSAQESVGIDVSAGRRVSVSEVFVRGSDTMIVEQGGATSASASVAAARDGRPVDVGRLGRGQVLYDLRRSEIRVITADGFVRVIGSLPPGDLLAEARRLEREPE